MDGITRNRWNRAMRLAGIAIIASATLMGGCKNSAKARLSALEQENLELRGRYRDAQTALSASEADRSALQGELASLRDENDRLRNADYNSNTGFEGIDGVTAATLASGEIVLDVAGDVLFDSGKVTLKSTAKQTLDRVATILNRDYGNRQIRVGGHTDSDPIRKSQWKTNERLSAERALAVEEYLASKGVENNRMFVAAFGSAFQKSSKASSRRVEIVVLNQAY